MIFLDIDDDFYAATTRSELAAALVQQLPAQPDDDTLAYLAAAVLGVEVMDVVIVEHHGPTRSSESDRPAD